MDNRIDRVIEYLKKNETIVIEGLKLTPNDSSELEISGWSSYLDLRNITRTIAIQELQNLKLAFSEMVQASANLSTFISNRRVRYILYYDDGGKASVKLCEEKDGKIEWGSYLQTRT